VAHIVFLRRCAPVRLKKIRNLGFSDLRRKENRLLQRRQKKSRIVAMRRLLQPEENYMSFIAPVYMLASVSNEFAPERG
jgi:hypothetical protein